MALVLLVEDDAAIAEPLTRALEREGHVVEHAADGLAGAAAGTHGRHELVLLDLGLPGLDGLEVCRRIRAARPDVPLLMLTARSEEIDAVVGLDAGADDYVAKPFRLAELLARIRALLRRGAPQAAPARAPAGGVRVDPAARRAWVGEEELALTPKEFDLLAYLVARTGDAVPRQQIMDEVWDVNWFGSTKTLDVHVAALRRKLGDDGQAPRLLTTVRGVGLRFESDEPA
ncbi:response regulator transcription factor [Paraconexibacter algicola]|uniref:DNA-binding response regulator n=1 Tax=Paraconexibacter algicola TaxID=2133960 RepID=A0A2T4ULY0_9ACTN|nr:response regulator transcription factor [Paraconexibacter algicola]PTL60218.1 DNA-binding response regulator [Paraconexibacter algicola]